MYESFDGQNWEAVLERLRVGKQNADWTACAFFWRQAQISSSTTSLGKICPNDTNTPALSNVYESCPSAEKLLPCTERQ